MGNINIIQAKTDLTSIAAMAWGSGLTEGRSGGEGHIGMIGNRVVKFNTHGNEYGKGSLDSLQKADFSLFSQMMTSSDVLRAKLKEIKNSVCKNGVGDFDRLSHTLDEVLDKDNAKWSDNGLLKRKAVAKAVTEINKFLGGRTNEEVWGGVENIKKSLQTRDIADTRALFKQAGGVQAQVEELKANAAAALKAGTKWRVSQDVVSAGQNAFDVYQKKTQIGRPGFRAERDSGGKWSMVHYTRENQQTTFDGYGLGKDWFVSKEDFTDMLRYDRLRAINEGVKAMIQAAEESFPGCELNQFMGYGQGQVFDDVVKGLDRKSVAKGKEKGGTSYFAVDEKNYGVALRKLQEHFMKVASRPVADEAALGTDKSVARAAARELSRQIVVFLKRLVENTSFGDIQTLREKNPNHHFVYHDYTVASAREHDESKDNADWNAQLVVKLDDGETKFWETEIVGTCKGVVPRLDKTLTDPLKIALRTPLAESSQKNLRKFDEEQFTTIKMPDDVDAYGADPSGLPDIDKDVTSHDLEWAFKEKYELDVRQTCSGRSRGDAIRLVLNQFTQTSQVLRDARNGNETLVIDAYKSILMKFTGEIDSVSVKQTDLENAAQVFLGDRQVSKEQQQAMRSMLDDLGRALNAVDEVYGASGTYARKASAPLEEHKKFLRQLPDAIEQVRKEEENYFSDRQLLVEWDEASGWKIVLGKHSATEPASTRSSELRESLQFIADYIDPLLGFKVRQRFQKVLLDTYHKRVNEYKKNPPRFQDVYVSSYKADELQKIYEEFKSEAPFCFA